MGVSEQPAFVEESKVEHGKPRGVDADHNPPRQRNTSKAELSPRWLHQGAVANQCQYEWWRTRQYPPPQKEQRFCRRLRIGLIMTIVVISPYAFRENIISYYSSIAMLALLQGDTALGRREPVYSSNTPAQS